MLSPGDLLNNRYTIIRTLGTGAYGTVYLAEDRENPSQHRAVKEIDERELPPEDRADAAELFRREAEILAKLDHPCLPNLKDFFTLESCHFCVLPAARLLPLHVLRPAGDLQQQPCGYRQGARDICHR